MNALLTASEVAALLRFSIAQVYRWANSGQLPTVQFGRSRRFRREDIERIAAEGLQSGAVRTYIPQKRARPARQKGNAKAWDALR